MRDYIVEIPDNNPFKNDQFGREIIARNFMKIFDKDEQGIILSIDSSWGTGKTTFINMWESLVNNDELYKDKYETLYFNAWESDYMSDPLLAILTEIEISADRGIKNIVESGKKVLSTLGNAAIKLGSAGALEGKDLDIRRNDVEKKYANLVEYIGTEALEYAINSKNIREQFKNDISKLTEETGKKIIFFIDELDRCRPKFAIELLETIKHLFSMKGVIFVISLDKEQLSHSIATIYGQNMDANGYLRRFFDLDYRLPSPDTFSYFEMKIKLMFNEYENIEYLEQFLKTFILEYNMSLRDVDKLYEYLKIIVPIMEELKGDTNSYYAMEKIVKIFIYSYLIILKIKYPDLYDKVSTQNYELDLIDKIFKLDNISNMDFNIRKKGKISNEEMLSAIKTNAIKKYLILNTIAKNDPRKVYNMEDDEYMLEVGKYNYRCNLAHIFDFNGNCKLRQNLDFINEFNI